MCSANIRAGSGSRRKFAAQGGLLLGGHLPAELVTVLLHAVGTGLGRLDLANQAGVGLVSWYWHFVDAVWVVVFTVVYLVGR